MYKKIIKVVIAVVIVVAIVTAVFIYSNNKFSFDFDFFGGDLEIDKTENVIQEIKKISELTTICYYKEVVIKDKKSEPTMFDPIKKAIKMGGDSCSYEVVLIAKGKVRAGFNLEKISEKDITIDSGTLTIEVPCAEILDVIVNPSDYEVYNEEGNWSHEDIVKVQNKTAAKIKQDALNDGIIEKANRYGTEKLEMLFKPLGFKNVVINLKY